MCPYYGFITLIGIFLNIPLLAFKPYIIFNSWLSYFDDDPVALNSLNSADLSRALSKSFDALAQRRQVWLGQYLSAIRRSHFRN